MDSRPRVFLIGKVSSLNLAIVDNLIANYCQVVVFTADKNYWLEKTFYLTSNKYFSITDAFESVDFAYCIIDLRSFTNNLSLKNDLEKIYQTALSKNAKVLLIAPLVIQKEQEKLNLKFIKNYFQNYDLFSTIFVGETFGPREESEESLVSEMINRAFVTREASNYSKDFYVFPTYSAFLAKSIVKEIFSFTNPGKEVLFISTQIKYSEVLTLLQQLLPDLKKNPSIPQETRDSLEVNKRYIIEINLKKALGETIEWLVKFPPKILDKPKEKKPVVKPVVKPLIKLAPIAPLAPIEVVKKKDLKRPKFIKNFLISLALFLLVPWFLLCISLFIFWTSLKTMEAGRFNTAKILLNVSSKLASLAQTENLMLTGIPVVGQAFFTQQEMTSLFISTSNVGQETASVLEDFSLVFNNALKNTDYDLAGLSNSLGLKVDTLYKDLSFLEGDFANLGIFKSWVIRFVEDNRVGEVRQQIFLSKNIFYKLPILLGVDRKTTYLVLFQNNMELRPTGGFIGSFALVTFEKGHMTSFDVHDVYEADGALNGHVEPPEPIKKYLLEAGWYLRDSNWDSDFPTSASKSEWFLGKELNKQVDGVIAIDLNVVAKLLDTIGPVYLSDYNKEINSGNLYEEVQKEAEENFFPGSQQKRNILINLSRVLIQKLAETDSKKDINLARALYESLKGKHVLVFMHERSVAEAFREMGFDGSVKFEKCLQKNCYQDWMGIVEANLGVNKENYYLKRSLLATVELQSDFITRTLTINYQNTDPSGAKNRSYKNYLRILLPLESNIEGIAINGSPIQNYDLVETQGHKEAGFLVEVPPLAKSQVVVVWKNANELDFKQPGIYKLNFRKQPGTDNDFLSVAIKPSVPINVKLEKGQRFLTGVGQYVYNTNLAEDLGILGLWK